MLVLDIIVSIERGEANCFTYRKRAENMTITNFNQSNNGVNISLDIYLDGDHARVIE